MLRLFPPKTNVPTTIYRGFTWSDVFLLTISLAIATLVVFSNIFVVLKIAIIFILIALCVILYLKYGATQYQGYTWLIYKWGYFVSRKKHNIEQLEDEINFYIDKDYVELDNGKKYCAVYHIDDVNISLFSEDKQETIVKALARYYRLIPQASIVKIEVPIKFDNYVNKYSNLRDSLLEKYQSASDDKTKEVISTKISIVENWLNTFITRNSKGNEVMGSEMHLIIYATNLEKLEEYHSLTIAELNSLKLNPKRLNYKELSSFMNYYETGENGSFEFSEIETKADYFVKNNEKYCIACIKDYPVYADGNYWGSDLFNIKGTTAVCKFELEDENAYKRINKTIKDLKYRYLDENNASGQSDLTLKTAALELLIDQLQRGNEKLFKCNFYIKYKKSDETEILREFSTNGFILDTYNSRQFKAYKCMNPFSNTTDTSLQRDLQSETLSAFFPFIHVKNMDKSGDYLGDYYYPIMWDLWDTATLTGNKKRKNANLFVHGVTGSGKSRTLKQKLMQEITNGTKVFIFDVEKEYHHFANRFGGKVVNMSGGTIVFNPFQIFAIGQVDDEFNTNDINKAVADQILFFTQWISTLVELDVDCSSMLGEMLVKTYKKAGIYSTTNIMDIPDEQWPNFNDLRKIIETELKRSDLMTYEEKTLYKLLNYVKPFTDEGMYAPMWNKKTNMNDDNDIIVFDFHTMFANGNIQVCNAQMMLVLRYIMLNIIKIKEHNEDHPENIKKVIALIDEAHMYVKQKYMIALETLENFARRFRKYYASLWIATQSIGDFMGCTDEMKSMANSVIDNCMYQIVLPQQSQALQRTIEMFQISNPLTEAERDFIANADVGNALFVMENDRRTPVAIKLLQNELQYVEPNKVKEIKESNEIQTNE